MARFYARFDHATITSLQENSSTKGFDKRTVGAVVGDGTLLRNGLIASRSALSDEVYLQLDSVNKGGTNGTYFPPDKFVTDQSTFISGAVYTSSLDGIKVPTTNTYDVGQAVNYSKRPTASVLSSTVHVVSPANPVDTGSATYNTYINASTAVTNTLNSIRRSDSAVTNRGPLARLGNNPSRTLHSIWNDPGLQYIAWDDYTPGTGSVLTANTTPEGGTGNVTYVTHSSAASVITIDLGWSTEYAADKLGTATLDIAAYYVDNDAVAASSISNVNTSAAGTYSWVVSNPASDFLRATGSNGMGVDVKVTSTIQFADVTIPTSFGAGNTTTVNPAGTIQRLFTLTTRTYAANTSTGACYPIPRPIYAAYKLGLSGNLGTISDPNPAGSDTANFIALLQNDLATGTPFTPTVDEVPTYGGNNYWLVHTTTSEPSTSDFICEYANSGVQVGASCVAATACYTPPTTTTTSTTSTTTPGT